MTVVPEDPRHTHDRRYPSLNHVHDARYQLRKPPRLRGRMPDKAVVSNFGPVKWDGALLSSYAQDRVTWDNGTITFAEAGMYQIAGQVITSNVRNEQQRMFLAWESLSDQPRASMGMYENVLGYSFVVGVGAGTTGQFVVYQTTPDMVTFHTAYLNIIKIADL